MVLVYLFKDILCKSTFLKLKYLSRKQYKFFNIILLFSLSKSNPKFSTFKISGFKLFKYFGGRFRSLECLFNKLKINSIKCLKIFLILKIILQTHYSFILKSASYDTSTIYIKSSHTIDKGLNPFYYQKVLLKKIINSNNFSSVVVKCYCGLGKVFITLFLSLKLEYKTLFLLNNLVILKQWVSWFLKFTYNAKNNNDELETVFIPKPSNLKTVFSNYFTTYRVFLINMFINGEYFFGLEKVGKIKWDLIVLDDAQLVSLELYSKKCIHSVSKTIIAFVRCFPCRMKSLFIKVIGPIISSHNLEYNSSFKSFSYNKIVFLNVGTLSAKTRRFLKINGKRFLLSKEDFSIIVSLKFLLYHYIHNDTMKILVFCSDKKFFEKIARIFSVPFISSKTSSCEKELILSNFKTDNQKNILVMSRIKDYMLFTQFTNNIIIISTKTFIKGFELDVLNEGLYPSFPLKKIIVICSPNKMQNNRILMDRRKRKACNYNNLSYYFTTIKIHSNGRNYIDFKKYF